MKTLMQEVYENFNLMSDADFKAWMLNTDLLEREKNEIVNFGLKCKCGCGKSSDKDIVRMTIEDNHCRYY